MEYRFTTENFEEEVLKADIPVLVDFYAEWCGPCKMMAPVLQQIADEYQGRIKVGKCDTDENMPLAQKYRVSSIPNLQLFKAGEPAANYVGFMKAEELKAKLDQELRG